MLLCRDKNNIGEEDIFSFIVSIYFTSSNKKVHGVGWRLSDPAGEVLILSGPGPSLGLFRIFTVSPLLTKIPAAGWPFGKSEIIIEIYILYPYMTRRAR
jgi:hypothetical protein